MIASSAGTEPAAGNPILMRPLNPTQLLALMSNSGSVLKTDQVDSSMTKVNVPLTSTLLEIVKDTAVGGGEKSAMSNVKPLRVSVILLTARRMMDASMVAPTKLTGALLAVIDRFQ